MNKRKKYRNYIGALFGPISAKALEKVSEEQETNDSESLRQAIVYYCVNKVCDDYTVGELVDEALGED